jgi:hypothetical protein
MKLVALSKQEPPFAEYRKKLRAAIEAGKITEETDLPIALRLAFGPTGYLDSHNTLSIMVAVKIRGPEFGFPIHNVRELLWLLEQLDREYELKRKEKLTD